MLPPRPLLTKAFRMAAYLICIGACVCLGLTYGVLLSGAFRPKADVFNMIWPIPVMAGVLAGTALYVLRPEGLTTLRRVGLAASAVLVLQALPYAQLQPHPDSLPPRSETGEALRLASFNHWHLNRDPDAGDRLPARRRFRPGLLQEVGGASRQTPLSLQEDYPYQVYCAWGTALISRRPVLEQGCDEYRTVAGRLYADRVPGRAASADQHPFRTSHTPGPVPVSP
jgi:endonuclease/exonuclease/phosphatase (EEP) superfamily protein YafD